MISTWWLVPTGIVSFLLGWIGCAVLLYERLTEYEDVIDGRDGCAIFPWERFTKYEDIIDGRDVTVYLFQDKMESRGKSTEES